MRRIGSIVALRRSINGFVVLFDTSIHVRRHQKHHLAIGHEEESIDDLAVGHFSIGKRRHSERNIYEMHGNGIVSLFPERLIGAAVFIIESPRPSERSSAN